MNKEIVHSHYAPNIREESCKEATRIVQYVQTAESLKVCED